MKADLERHVQELNQLIERYLLDIILYEVCCYLFVTSPF